MPPDFTRGENGCHNLLLEIGQRSRGRFDDIACVQRPVLDAHAEFDDFVLEQDNEAAASE